MTKRKTDPFLFLKLAFITLGIFLFFLIGMFVAHEIDSDRVSNYRILAQSKGYKASYNGELILNENIKIGDKTYIKLEITHRDFFGNSNTEQFILLNNIENLDKMKIGNEVTLFFKRSEPIYFETENAIYQMVNAYGILNTPNTISDILLVSLFLGIPLSCLIFIIFIIIFIITICRRKKVIN